MEVMRFKKFIRHYLMGESIKEIELNRILDKVSKKKELESREKSFLDLYNQTSDDYMKDYMYLSRSTTFSTIRNIMEKGLTIICDLYDKNGLIGLKIENIINDYENERSIIILSHEEKCFLEDKFLYNLIYDSKKNRYSLQAQDEYYEKIPINNEN